MNYLPLIEPFLPKLNLDLPAATREKLDAVLTSMVADPLYPSVSKIAQPEEIAQKHILDSIAPCGLDVPFWRNAKTLLDLGTGGGFPSVPLAVLYPGKKVWAADAKHKAIDFIGRAKMANRLDNLFPIAGRAEDLGRDKHFREKLDVVVCRALASIRVLLEYCLPLVKVGGFVCFYKGPKLEEELTEAQNALKLLKVGPADLQIYLLEPPLLPFSRGYVVIKKMHATPVAYPRRNGVPSAQPL